MTVTTPTTYNILKSIEGQLLGLDQSQASSPKGDYSPYLMGRDFRGFRFFPLGKTGMLGNDYKVSAPVLHNDFWDDFLGATVSAVNWFSRTGSNGTVAIAIHAANNGTVRLTSGSGVTFTMAVNGVQIVGMTTLLISDAGTKFETNLGNMSAATSQSICFGLCDSTALSAPFTLTTATVTANATNGACFLQDAAGTNTNLNCVSVNAGGSPQVVALATKVGLATVYNTFRIEIDALGNAMYFIDGVLVATIALAVATTSLLAPTIGMFAEAASSQTLDVDYVMTQELRLPAVI